MIHNNNSPRTILLSTVPLGRRCSELHHQFFIPHRSARHSDQCLTWTRFGHWTQKKRESIIQEFHITCNRWHKRRQWAEPTRPPRKKNTRKWNPPPGFWVRGSLGWGHGCPLPHEDGPAHGGGRNRLRLGGSLVAAERVRHADRPVRHWIRDEDPGHVFASARQVNGVFTLEGKKLEDNFF